MATKEKTRSPKKYRQHWRLRALTLTTCCVGLGIVMANSSKPPISLKQTSIKQRKLDTGLQQLQLQIPSKISNQFSNLAPEKTPALENVTTKRVKVKAGDSLSSLFSQQGLAYKELLKIQALGEVVKPLKTVFPGEVLQFSFDNQHRFQQLSYALSDSETLLIKSDNQGHYQAERLVTPLEKRQEYAQGRIKSSLFLAGQEAGISQATIMELANIFGWDIDFALDVREGDRFSLVYETLYKEGEKVGNGKILAAEFVNRGTSYQAVLYQKDAEHSAYYSPDKHSLRKTFLRTPVDFTRISSGFTNKRYHPVLKRVRAHRGVDYAASKGTPIRSTGDGKIVFRGRKGGYGRTVIVQHGQRYTTLYAHMSSYNRKLHSGSRIRQGQVIGYVGMSGTATGYHLHYEFRINGVHRNPLTVKLPAAQPLEAQYHADFDRKAQPLLSQLNTLSRYSLALKD